MRWLALPLLALAACQPVEEEVSAPAPQLIREDCYTVRLFDDRYGRNIVMAPGEAVPAPAAALSGTWGQGAWDGGQCHEIHVTEIFPDGSALVMDTHAPHEGLRATGFRRAARISQDGTLTLSDAGVRRDYTLIDGQLHGIRRNRNGSTSRIILLPQPGAEARADE